MTVAVIGGGLAGIAAALRCADAGRDVTLFEARPRLGGLTHSFRRGDLDVDNGQHVFLRCCTAYRALLDRLAVTDQVALQPRLDVPVLSPGARRPARLRRGRLPAPLHLGGSVLRYAPLSLAERARFARAALALRRVDPDARASDQRTFGDWLAAHGQDPRAVTALWDLVGVATLNARAAEASLALAATVFQVGLLTEADAADIGWSMVPLGRLHGDAAAGRLAAIGARVRTGAKVTGLERNRAGWVVAAGGEEHAADEVVMAVPPAAAADLLPPDCPPLPDGWAARLGSSPIVNVHVVYDRKVLDEPFLAGVDTPVQWVFDRTVQSGLTEGQYVAVSLSAAHDHIGRPTADIRAEMLPALADLLPAARRATVRDFFVTREREATFRPAPGTAALRPPPGRIAPGLYLAGAWTATGWPATMESAVRSGDAAAAALLADPAAVTPATICEPVGEAP
jgi:squalene-associated FAD-dependent desaturase